MDGPIKDALGPTMHPSKDAQLPSAENSDESAFSRFCGFL